jgi:hypothetical protein
VTIQEGRGFAVTLIDGANGERCRAYQGQGEGRRRKAGGRREEALG